MPAEVIQKGLNGESDITDDMFTKREPGRACVQEAIKRLIRNWSLEGIHFVNAKGMITYAHTAKDKTIHCIKR